MSIDDIPGPSALGVDVWRSVLHDVVDEVLDEILRSAELEREDEPPGDPPGSGEVREVPDLSTSLRTGLAAAIERGVAVRGCDGTLRCTREFTERILDSADSVVDAYGRRGVPCDCAVLRTVLGRTDVRPSCANRTRDTGLT